MPAEDGPPEVIPSQVDPDVECVRVDAQAPSGEVAAPPGLPADPPSSGAAPADDDRRRLCPDGYVPRRRRRRDYDADGKSLVTGKPPERNPDAPGD